MTVLVIVMASSSYRNPQLEVQASDRCHRVGQTKDVVVHRQATVVCLYGQ